MANSHPGLGLNLGVPPSAPTKQASPQLTVPAAIGITPASPTEPDGPSPAAGPSKSSPRQGLQPLQTQFDPDQYDQRHQSIPPPPSPRRHRAGMSRVRGNTGGGISTSKSWADLTATAGVAIGSSRSPATKEDRRAVSEHHRVFSHGDLTEEPWDEAPYDNR